MSAAQQKWGGGTWCLWRAPPAAQVRFGSACLEGFLLCAVHCWVMCMLRVALPPAAMDYLLAPHLHMWCSCSSALRHPSLPPAEAALTGRTDTFKRVVFDDVPVPASYHCRPGMPSSSSSSSSEAPLVRLQPGDYVAVEVTSAGGTLHARALARTTLQEFVAAHGSAAPLEPVGSAMPSAAAAAAAVGE